MTMHLIVSLIVAAVLIQIAVLATTIYLHRCATHGAFELTPRLHHVFRWAIFVLTGQITKEWVAVHRKHHAFSDEPGDPHSPVLLGFWSVQLGNAIHYVREKRNLETIRIYGRGVYEDRMDQIFNLGIVGPIVGIVTLCLGYSLFWGWAAGIGWGLFTALVHAVIYVGLLTSCVNAIGHHRIPTGYQNYGERFHAEKTFNYKWLAWLTGGEGLHNNHHGFPKKVFLAHLPGEPDPARPLINYMIKKGWATHVWKSENEITV